MQLASYMYMVIANQVVSVHVYCRLHHQNTSEPAYELVTQPTPGEVKLEKNPAYSVADVQDSSVDHHYDFISDSGHAKVKKQI